MGPRLSRCCRFWAVDVHVPAACRALVDELEWEIAQVDPRKTIQMGSFRINPDGSQSVVEVGSVPAGSCLAAGGLWVGAMGGAELAGAAAAQRGDEGRIGHTLRALRGFEPRFSQDIRAFPRAPWLPGEALAQRSGSAVVLKGLTPLLSCSSCRCPMPARRRT